MRQATQLRNEPMTAPNMAATTMENVNIVLSENTESIKIIFL